MDNVDCKLCLLPPAFLPPPAFPPARFFPRPPFKPLYINQTTKAVLPNNSRNKAVFKQTRLETIKRQTWSKSNYKLFCFNGAVGQN